MNTKQTKETNIRFMYKPGNTMPESELHTFNAELRRVAASCFDKVPEYQCLVQTREALRDKIITTARRPDGTLVGFCSAVGLQVDGVGEVLHLGLTCVHPSARGERLTHKLTSRLLIQYLMRRPLEKVWVTNVACVLSSLGNVALNFDQVFPSPYCKETPSDTHQKIAAAVSARYRDTMAIEGDADFCTHTFVFRGSVKDTIFQKSEHDNRYHHRKAPLNRFYTDLMRFEEGDEVLQVGNVSLLTLLRYAIRPAKRKPRTLATQLLAAR